MARSKTEAEKYIAQIKAQVEDETTGDLVIATVRMSKTKETKNGVRYDIVGAPDPALPWLKSEYLSKIAFTDDTKPAPEEILLLVMRL